MFEEDKRHKGSKFNPASLDGNLSALLATPGMQEAQIRNAKELYAELDKKGLVKNG